MAPGLRTRAMGFVLAKNRLYTPFQHKRCNIFYAMWAVFISE